MFRDRFSRMNKFRKRAFAVALATAVASTSFNIGSIAANAGTSARGRVIVAFEELPGDIVEQTLPIGGKKTDLNLPEELDVLLYSEEAEKEGRKKETVSKDRTDDATETPTESPADEKQSEGATEAASEESQDSDTDTANTDTGSANDGSAVTPDSSRDGDTASEPTNETGTDGDSMDSQPTEGGDSAGETGEDTVDTSGRLTDRMLTAIGSTFIPVKAYAAEPETEESEEAESGTETQGDGAADTVHAVQPSANSASDTGADEAADKGGKKTDEESSVEPETGSATEAATESPAGSSGRTAAEDSSDDSREKVTRLTDGERRTLEDVRWKLVRDKSEYGSRFQAIREGDVFYFAPDIKAYGLKSDVDLPEIRVTIVAADDETASGNDISGNAISGNGVSENSISGNTVSENSYPEFDQFMIVSGVKVSVTAPEGVFPEGAVLKVKRIDDAASNEKIEQAVKEDMGLSDAAEVNGVKPDGEGDSEDGGSASLGESLNYISFDITITDVSGNEIQPNTEYGKANVTFSQVDIISDYLSAPGEETEGKLGEDITNATDASSGSVVIGGDEAPAGRKALRVYHFDDGIENAQRMESSVDSAESAVTAEAEHFSPWTIASSTTAATQAAGDFILECAGARFDISEEDASTQDKRVRVKITPAISSETVDINVRLIDPDSTTDWGLEFESDGGYHDINVTLDNVTIDRQNGTSDINCINLINGYHYNLYMNESVIKAARGTGKGNALNVENSKATIIIGEGESKLVCGRNNDCIMAKTSQIEIDAAAREKGKCTLKCYQGDQGDSPSTVRLFNADSITLNAGTVDVEGMITVKNLYLTGGFLTVGQKSSLNGVNVNVTGGTHSILTSSYSSDKINITGGSVRFIANNILATSINGYNLSLIMFEPDYKNLPIEEIRVGTNQTDKNAQAAADDEYGLVDCQTDDFGNLYLWMPNDDKHYIYSVTLGDVAGSGMFVPAFGDFTYAYVGADTIFVPYNPMDINELTMDTESITFGENKLHKLITAEDYQGNKYTVTDDDGRMFNESGGHKLTNNLYDIDWTLTDENGNTPGTDRIEITRDPVFNYNNRTTNTSMPGPAVLNLKKPGVYTLTAKLYDKVAGNSEKIFKIAAIKSVTDIKSYSDDGNNKRTLSSTLYLNVDEKYTLTQVDDTVTVTDSDNNELWEFVVEPSDATNQTIVWTWDASQSAAGATISGSGPYTLKISNAGDFTGGLVATIKDGTVEGDFVKKFDIHLEALELSDEDVTLDPDSFEYTGKEIKPEVTVKSGDEVLTEGKDYTVSYKNNVNKAKATDTNPPTVTVTGKGKYSGTVNKTFNIGAISIKDDDVTLDKSVYQHTGSKVKPVVTVKHNDTVLTEGTDYTVDYPNSVAEGDYTLKVTGIGNYTGDVSKTFTIAKLPTGTITIAGQTYNDIQTEDDIAAYVKAATTADITAKNAAGSAEQLKIYYKVSNKYYGSEGEITAAISDWTDYDASKPVTAAGNNYIYAKITEGSTRTAYLSTKNIVDDRTAPSVSINSATVGNNTSSATVTATDALSGVSKYYLMVKKSSEEPPTKDDIVANGLQSTTGSFTISGLSTANQYTFYAVAEDKAGNISDWVKRTGTASKGEISANIKVMGHTYDKLQGKQETDDYTNEQKEIKISATGNSGVAKIEYFITDKFYSSASAIEGAAKETKGSGNAAFVVSNWATYNDSSRPYLLKNKLNYIYVKITDNGGGVTYISSKGIWEDEINPTTSSTSSTPKDTTAASTVKGTDKESGVKNYYLLVRKATDSAPSKAEDVKSAGMKSEDGKFSLTGLTASTKYTVYTVTEDRAGNLSAIKKTSFTTKKATDANADAAKKAAAAASAAAAAAAKGSGSNGTGGKGSNVAKRTASANGSGSVSDNADSGSSDGIRDGVPYIEDATDGILIGRENTSGWERIESEAGKASQPSQIHVDMNGSTVVPAAALRQCRDRDITYYFRLNDDITWAVNGLSFTADPGDIDFRVRTDTRNIPSKLVNEVADVYPHTNLTIEHDGDFGFTAILSVNVGSDNEGMYANLYYYDEGNNALNFMDSTEVDGGGRASFEFLHASDYTVILRGDALTDKSAAALTDDNFMSTDDTSATSSGPVNVSRNTGNLWLIVVSVISFLLCGLILFIPDKRNRRRGPANAVS